MQKPKIYNMRELKATGNITGLIEALDHDGDASIRLAARFALIGIGRPAVPCLLDALKNHNSHVRRGAAAALGGIGDDSALDALAKALEDKDPYVGWYAAFGLGGIGSVRSVGPLLVAILTGDPSVSRAAYISLEKIGNHLSTALLVELFTEQEPRLREIASSALSQAGEQSLPWPVIKALRKAEDEVSESAA